MSRTVSIVDEYGLSPMQQGMLSHTLASPEGGVYTIVVSYRLNGPLAVAHFTEAWRRVVAHHPILRTSFEWQGRTEARQVVHAEVPLDVHLEDWSALGADVQAERLERFLETEQRRGFDVGQAPLLRLSLLTRGRDDHEFVLAHHHLLMDGSCKPLLFSQVFAAYQALASGRPVVLETARPFREFIEWLRAQPQDATEAYWRRELKGVAVPAGLWTRHAPAVTPDRDYHEHRTRLDEAGSDAVRQWARRQRITLNTVVSGMWALVLANATNTHDVMFGATVNGRPDELEGVEWMLGLFINTLPVRISIDPAMPAAVWLPALQRRQAEMREHGLASLASISRWSGVGGGRPLFDSVLVFENNAGYGAGVEHYGDVSIATVTPVIRNSLPMTLRCVPDRAIELHLLHDAHRFSPELVRLVADQMMDLLAALPGIGEAPVSSLLTRLADIETAHSARSALAYEAGRRDSLRSLRRDGRGAGRGPI